MLRTAVLALLALGLSASRTKGTVGEGQLPPPGAPLRVRVRVRRGSEMQRGC